MKELISLPDAKNFKPALTLGKMYSVLRVIGNCSVILSDDELYEVIILSERLKG